jgi:hypothetical protein
MSSSRMVRLCRVKGAELSSYIWSYLVVFGIGPVRNEIVFGYMYRSKFWMFDMLVPAFCMNQIVLYEEGSSRMEKLY